MLSSFTDAGWISPHPSKISESRSAKHEMAEAINRRTLRQKVLGIEHPDTLMSVPC